MEVLTHIYIMVYIIFMIRTQIYLPDDQVALLKLVAWQKKLTMSEIIRQSLEKNYPQKTDSASEYAQKLLNLKTDWFDETEWQKNREEINKRQIWE